MSEYTTDNTAIDPLAGIAEPPMAKQYAHSMSTPMMSLIDDQERPFWMAWNRVRGIGPVRFERLLTFFGSAKAAWEAINGELRECGIDDRVLAEIIRMRETLHPIAELERLQQLGIAVLTTRDAEYPYLLRQIPLPPFVLYVRGTLVREDERALAIVGTRRVTTYGKAVTEMIVKELVHNGMTIVSGLARGIDAIAHQIALDMGGRTIAVMGCGIDLVYPPEHDKLAARIVHNGALMSEYSPGIQPDAGNFPARNRIISGLAGAVVVTEAPERSGALITAEFAQEHGREVMAIPGNITSPSSKGCNHLIQQGAAHCITSGRDILEHLNVFLLPEHFEMREAIPTDPQEDLILKELATQTLHVDDLCRATALPAATVLGLLLVLEMKGLVRNLGGMMYMHA